MDFRADRRGGANNGIADAPVVGKTIKIYGVLYILVKQEKNIFMYSLTYPENPKLVVGYDVIVGDKIPPPSQNYLWGVSAWSWTTQNAADNQFEELLGREPKNIPATISERGDGLV